MLKFFDLTNNAMIVAIASFLINILYKKWDSVKTFVMKCEIRNDIETYNLLQVELYSIIICGFICSFIVDTVKIKYNINFLASCLILFILTTLSNLIILTLFMCLNKKLKKLSKKNLIAIIILNITFVISWITYIEDDFIMYRKYAKCFLSTIFVACFVFQFIKNCKRIQVKNIIYKIDTLDYEHYVTNNKPTYKDEFIIIKLKSQEKIGIPISRIKKIKYIIDDIENEEMSCVETKNDC